MQGLGPATLGLVVGALLATVAIGLAIARLLGHGRNFGLLTGGAVAICGASAAMAIAAVLPRREHAARDVCSSELRWALLTAIAAVGMKTSIPDLLKVGGAAIWLLVLETLALAAFVLIGVECIARW